MMRFLLFLVGSACFAACPATFSNGYSYCRAVTIDHTQVPNSDQTNFPVAIAGTVASLATVANGGHVRSSSGFDIIFTSDNAGTTLLKWETVAWSATTGTVEYWVQIPTVSHTSDTVFYLFYGNPAIVSDQSAGSTTWSTANYLAVYHFNLATGANPSTIPDSAGSSTFAGGEINNSGGITGEAGAIGQAASFGGTSYGFRAGDTNQPTGTSVRTVSAWINQVSCSTAASQLCPELQAGLLTWGGNTSNGDRWDCEAATGQTLNVEVRNVEVTSTSTVPSGTAWHNVVCVFPSGGTTLADTLLYIDGVHSATIGSGSFSTLSGDLTLAATTTVQAFHPVGVVLGGLDEIQMSNVARSADWIATAYNNGHNISTFTTLGGEIANTGSGALPHAVGFL